MVYKKTELTAEVEKTLIAMSELWEQEDSCYGYRKNTLADIETEDIFLAYEGTQMVGYLLCHTYLQSQKSITVPASSSCLEVEELYVLPQYRSKGIGRELFRFAVRQYEGNVQYVTLSTATKNYTSILHFYIEELGMNFWSARLFMPL